MFTPRRREVLDLLGDEDARATRRKKFLLLVFQSSCIQPKVETKRLFLRVKFYDELYPK